MAKSKGGFYAVRVGREPGVYKTWVACEKQTKSFPDAKFEKFTTQAEAEAFAFPSGHPAATPSTASSSKRPRQPSPPPPTLSVKKPKGRSPTIYNHTAASVEPSTYDEATGLWKTESGRIVVYTDGSALGNGRQGAVAGLGVWWAKDSPRNRAERVPGPLQTNNRGELLAIIRAVETAPDHVTPLEIRTDSQYSIKCLLEWLPQWRNRGFKTKGTDTEVSNKDLITHLARLLDLRRKSTSSIDKHSRPSKEYDSDSAEEVQGEKPEAPVERGKSEMVFDGVKWRVKQSTGKVVKRTGGVKLTHVKAHVGLEGNEGADRLANIGAALPLPPLRHFGANSAKLGEDLSLPIGEGQAGREQVPAASSQSSAPAPAPPPPPPPLPSAVSEPDPSPGPAAINPAAPYGYTKTGRVRKKPLKAQRDETASQASSHDSSHTEATDSTSSSDKYGLNESGDDDFWTKAAQFADALQKPEERPDAAGQSSSLD